MRYPGRLTGGMVAISMWLVAAGAVASMELDAQLSDLRDARDLAGIEQVLENAGAEELESPEGLRWQAWLARARGDVDQARALAERGLERTPDNVPLMVMHAGIVLSGLSEASGFSALRKARGMRKELERAVELDENYVAARIALIEYYLNAPRIAGGGASRAEPHLSALQELDPAAYHGLTALNLISDGKRDAASDHFSQAMDAGASPNQQVAYAVALHQEERLDEARAVLESLVASHPRHGHAWYQLGRTSVLSQSGLDAGLAAFERFLELPPWPGEPPHAAAWWRIGMIHDLQGQPDRAREAWERALREDPEFEAARESLAGLQ